MKWYTLLGVIIAVILAISALWGLSNVATIGIIEIEENVATIRVPGEFEDELQLLYNGKYMTYTLENSVIKLKFLKPGYYHVNVENKDYVFLCGKNMNLQYDIDLIEKEYNHIRYNIGFESFIESFVTMFIMACIYFILKFGIPGMRKVKFKIKSKSNKKQETTTITN